MLLLLLFMPFPSPIIGVAVCLSIYYWLSVRLPFCNFVVVVVVFPVVVAYAFSKSKNRCICLSVSIYYWLSLRLPFCNVVPFPSPKKKYGKGILVICGTASSLLKKKASPKRATTTTSKNRWPVRFSALKTIFTWILVPRAHRPIPVSTSARWDSFSKRLTTEQWIGTMAFMWVSWRYTTRCYETCWARIHRQNLRSSKGKRGSLYPGFLKCKWPLPKTWMRYDSF